MKQVHFYICVPVYNTEKFLKKCVNSVIYQDYSNWTMIIVDDGSPDNSGVICDEFAKHHSNIIVVHQENEGLIFARQNAIKIAKQLITKNEQSLPYIMFLDSDDYLQSDALETIDHKIRITNSDLIIFTMNRVKNNQYVETLKHKKGYEKIVSDKRELYNIVLNDSSYNSLCRKAILADNIGNANYKDIKHIKHAEDLLQSLEVYRNCKNACFISDALYNYTINENSITQSENICNYNTDSSVRRIVLSFIENENVFTKEDINTYLHQCRKTLILMLSTISKFKNEYDKKKEVVNRLKSDSYYGMLIDTAPLSLYPLFFLKYNNVNISLVLSRIWTGVEKIFYKLGTPFK